MVRRKNVARIISIIASCAVCLALLSACAQERIIETSAPEPVLTDDTRESDGTVIIPLITPEPTDSPEDEAPVEEEPNVPSNVFIVAIEGTSYRSAPEISASTLLGRFPAGTRVQCKEDRGEFMLVETEEGKEVWCHSWFLDAEDKELREERASIFLNERMNRDTFIPIDGEPEYVCVASALNCRYEPSLSGAILHQIMSGTKVKVLGKDGSFFLCKLPNGRICYCSADWLSDKVTYVKYPHAVDLRVFLPGAEFDMLFASSNNITGHAMYASIPILEEKTAFQLLKAYQKFQEDGYTIKIYDAYRPISAQKELFAIVQDTNFIADPNNFGSWHQRGRAVDMSLVDLATGEELEMPTAMHTFSMDSARGRRNEWSETVRNNVDYMTKVMEDAGFKTIGTEWWHFEYTEPGDMLPIDIDLSSLTSYPVEDYRPLY